MSDVIIALVVIVVIIAVLYWLYKSNTLPQIGATINNLLQKKDQEDLPSYTETDNAIAIPNTANKNEVVCEKCGSTNIKFEIVQDIQLQDVHKSIWYWIFIGWWWRPLLWFFLTLPMLLAKLFGRKKQKVIQKQRTVCICQDCGNTWDKN